METEQIQLEEVGDAVQRRTDVPSSQAASRRPSTSIGDGIGEEGVSRRTSIEAGQDEGSMSGRALLPPVDRGVDAWKFVISSLCLELMVWGMTSAFGIFQNYYESNAPFNRYSSVQISAIGTLCSGFLIAEGLFVIGFYRSYPDWIKPLMWVSFGMATLALALASFAESLGVLIVTQGCLFGIFGGLLYYPTIVWLPEWFVERRGLAAGIIFGGNGAGGAIFPLLLTKLLESVGFRWTLRIFAALFFCVAAPAIYFCRPRIRPVVARPRSVTWIPPLGFTKRPLFWLDFLVSLLQLLGFYAVNVYLPTYARSIGLTSSQGTYALMAFNSSSTVGKILTGWAVDRVPYLMLLCVFGAAGSLAAFVMWGFAGSHLAPFVLFVLVFGAVAGSVTPTWPAACVQISGRQRRYDVSVIFMSLGESMALASVAGPLIAGSLVDKLGLKEQAPWGKFGYAAPTIFVGVSMALSSILAVGTGLARPKME